MDWADVPAALEDIESGRLRDTDQIRIVLAEANRMSEFERQKLWAFDLLKGRAQIAFIEGWPESATA